MKLLLGLCVLGTALAARFPRARMPRDTALLEVTVESVGNSALKASITNTGSEPVRLMKAGSILDDRAIERAEIYSGTSQISFEGIRLSLLLTNLSESAFVTLGAGATVANEWDPAEVHDLSRGGRLDFVIRGSFLTAAANSTEITGEIPFTTTIKARVDGPTAAKIRRSFDAHMEAKRADVQNDCTGKRGAAQITAVKTCKRLATQAQKAAHEAPDAKLIEFFADASPATRQAVARVYGKIAGECGSTTSGAAAQYCTDVLEHCGDGSEGILAYTVPTKDVMVSCGIYYARLTALTATCHAQDRATTTLHETTHLRSVAGTLDLAYGYELLRRLGRADALRNADTYTMFANAIEVGC